MDRSWKAPQGDPIQLQDNERVLAEDIERRLKSIHDRIPKMESIDHAEIDEMGAWAHDLHMLLAGRGHVPRHHKYMLKNRGIAADDPEFYRHVHPVEDLLRFVANPHANDDPEDFTLGHDFEFPVYSRRWGHPDLYRVKRTPSGWVFRQMQEVATGRDARVGRKGGTGLFHLLDHESVNYPEELPGYFEYLWEQAAEAGLNHDEVQAAISELAQWTSLCEENSPRGILAGFK